ncbi:SDR family oxidoreductase [Salinicoccus hispanicus]|uniref:SDR family oxidoreductase n=1 Tax=Salinicoccus hispanicus TaxID=157225 RepID=A0A6N8U154_9STAP|nr:SDR family oxidoreductase [Salinicoccus hispanicus]MXQ51482.1 SDR family oxidoreductase [Salinicoccus hispanicus]
MEAHSSTIKSVLLLSTNNDLGRVFLDHYSQQDLILYHLYADGLSGKVELRRVTTGDAEPLFSISLDEYKHLYKSSILLDYVKDVDLILNANNFKLNKDIQNTSLADWQQNTIINLTIPYMVVKKLYRTLGKSETKCIVNVSAVDAVKGDQGDASYCAASSALESMSTALYKELSPNGFRVNCLRFDFERANTSSISTLISTTTFLSSPLSKHINGQIINVDDTIIIA